MANTVYCCSFTVELSIVICSCIDINKNVSSFASQALLHEALKVQGPWHMRCDAVISKRAVKYFSQIARVTNECKAFFVLLPSRCQDYLSQDASPALVTSVLYLLAERSERYVRLRLTSGGVNLALDGDTYVTVLTQTFVLSRWY